LYVIEPMTQDDVEEVGEVERRCFPNPWPLSAYRRELRNPEQNFYIVLRDDPGAETGEGEETGEPNGDILLHSTRTSSRRPRRFAFWPLGRRDEAVISPPIIGFAGMWNLYDEAHVTTIGVIPEMRGRGLGELLLVALFDEAIRRRANWVTLEVRVTNHSAQALYRKYGFTIQGRRARYYSDNNEDAFIMWSASLRDPDYLRQLDDRRRRLAHKLSFDQATSG
jgi:ribosomal-protein-alanine N-acetyltransferase